MLKIVFQVLSRNHAILWFRDGEFWLKDTKSSNGTFVNNEKLQQIGTGRDTDVRRVFSGDIIQLGVEIVENANKGIFSLYETLCDRLLKFQ